MQTNILGWTRSNKNQVEVKTPSTTMQCLFNMRKPYKCDDLFLKVATFEHRHYAVRLPDCGNSRSFSTCCTAYIYGRWSFPHSDDLPFCPPSPVLVFSNLTKARQVTMDAQYHNQYSYGPPRRASIRPPYPTPAVSGYGSFTDYASSPEADMTYDVGYSYEGFNGQNTSPMVSSIHSTLPLTFTLET